MKTEIYLLHTSACVTVMLKSHFTLTVRELPYVLIEIVKEEEEEEMSLVWRLNQFKSNELLPGQKNKNT